MFIFQETNTVYPTMGDLPDSIRDYILMYMDVTFDVYEKVENDEGEIIDKKMNYQWTNEIVPEEDDTLESKDRGTFDCYTLDPMTEPFKIKKGQYFDIFDTNRGQEIDIEVKKKNIVNQVHVIYPHFRIDKDTEVIEIKDIRVVSKVHFESSEVSDIYLLD